MPMVLIDLLLLSVTHCWCNSHSFSSFSVQIDCELSKKLEWWDEKLRSEGQMLCKEHNFTTGFLEGGGSHSVVDSYELKVSLRCSDRGLFYMLLH